MILVQPMLDGSLTSCQSWSKSKKAGKVIMQIKPHQESSRTHVWTACRTIIDHRVPSLVCLTLASRMCRAAESHLYSRAKITNGTNDIATLTIADPLFTNRVALFIIHTNASVHSASRVRSIILITCHRRPSFINSLYSVRENSLSATS